MNKVEFSRTAKAPFERRYGNYINGKWAEPRSGRYFENFSPVNGRLLCEIARSEAQDIEDALDAAHAAKEAWGRTSVAERALILNRIADRMEENLDLLALAETWDNGSRSARQPRPTCRWPSTISAISRARSERRKAVFPKSTMTPSPITSMSRWAWSGRSSRGTFRC